MKKIIDIKANPISSFLKVLLQDKTSKKNIIWATDTYEEYGEGFLDYEQISAGFLVYHADIIKPRIKKTLEAQADRTKKKAEVFTPAWLCNKMNNYCDEEWFGRKNIFNIENDDNTWTVIEEKVEFENNTWQEYVDSKRLEITCGEAPYLVSRYDVVSGEFIEPTKRRIGILDRKLRVVNENSDKHDTWFKWVLRAFESVYGYEYQGDNLLIARINMLLTFTDYYEERWKKEPDDKLLNDVAKRIVWNIWQMDGLKSTLPLGKPYEEFYQISFFDNTEDTKVEEKKAISCKIYDWRRGCSRLFKKLEDMRMGKKVFDYIIGNPPYQEDTDGAGRQAKPIYNLFVSEAKNITPKSISLITPSRWFSGGMGLDGFRNEMLNDKRIKAMVDYTNAKDVFPNTSISGGVNFFIWKEDYNGLCTFTNTTNGETTTMERDLSEFPVLVRYNKAVNIIHKVEKGNVNKLTQITSGLMPFGLSTSYRGRKNSSEVDKLVLHASNGVSYISEEEINKGKEFIDKYQVLVSKTGAEHAGEPSKDGTFRVIPSSMKVIGPNEVCTHSYFLVGCFKEKELADNVYRYLRTRFVRFLMLMSMSGFGLSKLVMGFVPLEDFTNNSDIKWNVSEKEIERQLYKKYKLTQDEIRFIESNVKEMS